MTGVLDSIIEVFESMATWLADAVSAIVPMFYTAESGLTFIGVLAVASLAISVAFLILGVITNFIQFRG